MQKITVTSDCTLNIVLNGAGGGNGGSDASHKGAYGSPGDKVTCIINASAGDVYYVSVGTAGGNGGNSASGAAGGSAGYGLNGFSGGAGGRAGYGGSSGGGGGGGGATVLYKYTNEGYQYIAIAAGGAGGGGAGNYSNGITYEPVKRVSSYYNKYYDNTDNTAWSTTLRNYAVRNGDGTYYLEYGIWSETSQSCTLYASADDQATIYLNGADIGNSASWKSTSKHTLILNAGFNTLKFKVVNSGGGPTGFGAYLKSNTTDKILWTTRDAYNQYDNVYLGGRGGLGQSHQSDGGGAGGGGGGFIGGAGGTAAGLGYGGDHGANSGYPGVSFAMPIAEFNNATKLLKDQWEPLNTYSISILGGSARNTDGSFSVSSLSTSISIKQNSKFKSVYDIKYKTSPTWNNLSGWVSVKEAYYKENNVWIPLFKKDTFAITTVNDLSENNISGYMTPLGKAPVITVDTGGGYSTSDFGGGNASTGGVSCSDSNGDSIGTADGGMCSANGSGGGDGGSKIICTAMNYVYGFGSYRNSIWLQYSEKYMTKAHEVGYHALFLPLVNYAFYSGDSIFKKTVRKILEHVARHRTADLRAEMRGKKRDKLGRVYRSIFEPLCYLVGKLKGY